MNKNAMAILSAGSTLIPRIGFFLAASYLLANCNGSIFYAMGCLFCFYGSFNWSVSFSEKN